ncbi:cuticle protein 76-like [Bacillus rossius redtenbacheri]|uniref:cuticle protein 76-like n=1 Tax=Bacillus rossius redtenbacheri TaxID=93214 RepID=UPI002FDEC12E
MKLEVRSGRMISGRLHTTWSSKTDVSEPVSPRPQVVSRAELGVSACAATEDLSPVVNRNARVIGFRRQLQSLFIVLAVVVAVAKAGYLGAPAVAAYGAPAYGYGGYAAPAYAHGLAAPAAITSQHSNILRTPGNLGQVSTYSKTIDTPYSSVSKSDVRVSNDALAYGAAYHAPAYGAYAAPALAARAYAAPALAARAVAPGLLGVAYSAAPVVSHMTYTNAYGIHYAY